MCKNRLTIVISTFLMLCIVGCGNAQQKPIKIERKFVLPEIPTILQTPEQRAEYLTLHYWDNFDFADTVLINMPDITEQAFVDFVDILNRIPKDIYKQGVNNVLERAIKADTVMFEYFAEMFSKYLYDPNSPMRNEEVYIPVLEYIVASKRISDIYKVRPQYLLEMARKNRVGDMATDITFTTSDGKQSRLSSINGEHIILFFNNPDCHDCARVKQLLEQYVRNKAKVVAIYADDDIELWRKSEYPANWVNGYGNTLRQEKTYDLKAIPCLYLLDKDKKVIMKDAPVEEILKYLNER